MITSIVLAGASAIAGLSTALVWLTWGETPSLLFMAGGLEFTALVLMSDIVIMRRRT